MCGVALLWSLDGALQGPALGASIERMAATLHHRGPDETAVFIDTDTPLALGHTRLAVVDLSAAGSQPMHSADGRYVVSYNGEIYNASALRARVDHHRWRGHSDTEALLEHCARFGVVATLQRCRGMFAFALYDRRERALWLARDALGKKPLYYGRVGGAFVAASELKAFHCVPGFAPEIAPLAAASMLRRSAVIGRQAIFAGIDRLGAGEYLCISASNAKPGPKPYWRLAPHPQRAQRDWQECVQAVEDCVSTAVKRRLGADVPLGALLSGGIDSSLVTALMHEHSSRPVRTFSAAFEDTAYDESGPARAVARHLGCEHTELLVDASAARAVIARLPQIYDEPFADASQIPTALVCALTAEHVTVALTGDGGDESFAGYTRHWWIPRLRAYIERLPLGLRVAVGRTVDACPAHLWNRLSNVLSGGIGKASADSRFAEQLYKLSRAGAARDANELYERLLSPAHCARED